MVTMELRGFPQYLQTCLDIIMTQKVATFF